MLRISTILGVGIVFGLLAWIGITLTREEGRIAAVWLPNAFLVAILLRSNVKRGLTYLPAALAGNIIANVAAGDGFLGACSLALVNSLEISLIWLGMRQLNIPRPSMENLRELLIFCCIGGFLAPTISGLFATLLLSNGIWESAIQLWLKWAMSDGLGILLLAPMVMIFHDLWESWKQRDQNKASGISAASMLDWCLVLALGLVSSLIIFGQTIFPLLFMIMPVILLHAFRLGAPGTTIATLQIAVVATIFTSLDRGPIHLFDASLSAQLITLQLFLFCCFCIGLPVSAALAAKEKIRDALKESNTRSKLVAQAAPVGIFQADLEGKLLYVNEGICEMMGKSSNYLIKNGSMASFDAPAPWDKQLRRNKSEYSGLPRKLQIPISLADGTNIWLETLDVPELDKKGNITGYTGVVLDITESKELEKNLISARRHAEAAADAKSRFLANMSHEIRTPMNGVIGFTQLLLDSELSAQQRQQTKMILDSGNAMMRLLNNILDISKVEAGQVKISREPVNIGHILKSCVDLMAPTADQKSISLNLEIDPSMPHEIIGDGSHLRQIILNLLGNAIKFTIEGGVSVCASASAGNDDTAAIQIDIRDTGIGIPPDRIAAIFDPFEQADNNTTPKFGGTGLGLTISNQLAFLMEGTIEVDSAEGEGTTFRLLFPGKVSQSTQAKENMAMDIEKGQQPQTEGVNGEPAEASKGRLLLVEDHDVNQLLIQAMTERLGFETVLAVDGADAVAKVDEVVAGDKPFDLVLMDVQMPVMDGYQATRMIRASGISAASLPIIAITANAYSEDIEACLAAGMQAHISKPVMIGKLKAALDHWIASGADQVFDAEPEQMLPISADKYLNDDLRERYEERKKELLCCLASLVRSATFKENELQEAASLLHKLSGTAAMFGDAELGIKARMIETGLREWNRDERQHNIGLAVDEFLKAA